MPEMSGQEATRRIKQLLPRMTVLQNQEIGGGGIRTPVPRWFKISIYVCSRSIESSPP